ncbi:protein FRA10AC1 isoform X1 [Labeo rohita]|uniref:protein FRA10AC1 isoform X1 n=1 Tax=Labeo rohita TaxID=84645 RepID=UPI0021E3353F|nr:protein FRA10AC1 isoform X1 [Labeo rohita]
MSGMDKTALDLVKVHGGGGYDSDFSDDDGGGGQSKYGENRAGKDELLQKPFQKGKHTKLAHKNVAAHEWDREEARNRRQHLISMNAFERHKKFVSDYILYYGGKIEEFRRSKSKDKTDLDVVRENHRFLWREEDEEDMTWEKELAKKYYDKLFKEYCIADLSRYKENKFGFRWRIENEVISGKADVCLGSGRSGTAQSRSRRHTVRGVGSLAEKLPDDALFPQLKSGGSPSQFLCGNKRCENKEGLKSWEVNFAYVEQGEKRNALVKLRLCPECSFKLNYHHKRKEVTVKKRRRSKENVDKSVSKKSKSSRKHKRKDKRKHKKRRKEYSSSSSEESQSSDKDEESGEEEEEGPSESDHWRGPAPTVEEKSREEEFDEYFEDMFL